MRLDSNPLIDGFERPRYRQVILELNSDHLVCEGFEETVRGMSMGKNTGTNRSGQGERTRSCYKGMKMGREKTEGKERWEKG